MWVETQQDHFVLYDLHGSPIWTPGAAVGPMRGCLVLNEYQIVLVSRDNDLTGWPISGGPPVWRVPMLTGTRKLIAHPDGKSFVYLTGSEEIGRRRIETGEVIFRSLLHTRFRGAKFSLDSGLDTAVVDVLELGGAVFG